MTREAPAGSEGSKRTERLEGESGRKVERGSDGRKGEGEMMGGRKDGTWGRKS